jgi:DNA-binding IclR family transcriptional regulator
MNSEVPNPVKSTQTSFRIIEVLAQSGALGVTEVADQLDVTKGAVHNHLATLRDLGYVRKRGEKYALALRFLYVGERARNHLDVYRRTKSSIDNLAQTTGEVAGLYIEENLQATCAYHQTGSEQQVPFIVTGERTPLHACAAGKVILASLPEERIEKQFLDRELDALTDETVTDPNRLRRQIRRIRDDRVAFSRSEHAEGINEVAVLLRSQDGTPLGAISVSGSDDQLNGRHLEEDITGQVLSTAKQIKVAFSSQ